MRLAQNRRFLRLAAFFGLILASACSRYDDEPGEARLPRGTVFTCSVTLELVPGYRDGASYPSSSSAEAESVKDPPDACSLAIEKACEQAGVGPICVDEGLYRKVREDYDW